MLRFGVSSLVAILGPFDPRPQAEGWSTKSGVGVNEVSDRHGRSGGILVWGLDADLVFGEN